MTEQLIRKDLRLLRPVMWATLVLGLIFYVIGPGLIFMDWRHDTLKKTREVALSRGFDINTQVQLLGVKEQVRYAAEAVWGGSAFMWIVNVMLVTTIAGMAFAVERRERWGEFAGMLPVSRSKVVAAKALASIGVIAAILGLNAAVSAGAISVAERWDDFSRASVTGRNDLTTQTWFYLAVVVGMAGVAWLFSAILRSAVIATGLAIGMAVSVWCFLLTLIDQRGLNPAGALELQYAAAAFVLASGAACFVAGTIVQLRRQSP